VHNKRKFISYLCVFLNCFFFTMKSKKENTSRQNENTHMDH